ncbi:MAG: hypothetical protein N2114_05265 [Candidatus Goldbacteria bacterium]|nr:hypothetical protein [Candidatus Goldiibacteriota bacterium]
METKETKDKIIETFKNLKVVVDVIVNEENEESNNNNVALVKYVIKKEKNEDFYKLRDFFKVDDEPEFFDEYHEVKRYKYKKLLIKKLNDKSSYNQNLFLFLKKDIEINKNSIEEFGIIREMVSNFIEILKKCYEEIFNAGEYEIKVNFIE